MPQIYELSSENETEDHLWRHRLYVNDAYDVLEEGRYKVFRDGGREDRVKMVGPTTGGRMLTFIVSLPDEGGVARLITGWPADGEEVRMWERPGGTQDVRSR